MRRREFIKVVGGVAVAWPLVASAQKSERIRRIGMLAGFNDPDIKEFQDELEKHGWSESRNIHIDYRVAPAGTHVQTLAKELVDMQPEVIFRGIETHHCRVAEGDSHSTDRVHLRHRPDRRRLHRKLDPPPAAISPASWLTKKAWSANG